MPKDFYFWLSSNITSAHRIHETNDPSSVHPEFYRIRHPFFQKKKKDSKFIVSSSQKHVQLSMIFYYVSFRFLLILL